MKLIFKEMVFPNPINNQELIDCYEVGNLSYNERVVTNFYVKSGITYSVAVASGTASPDTRIYVDGYSAVNKVLSPDSSVDFTPENEGFISVVNKSQSVNVENLILAAFEKN